MRKSSEPLWQWQVRKTVLLSVPFTRSLGRAILYAVSGLMVAMTSLLDWDMGRFPVWLSLLGLAAGALQASLGLASVWAIRRQRKRHAAWPP